MFAHTMVMIHRLVTDSMKHLWFILNELITLIQQSVIQQPLFHTQEVIFFFPF